MLIPRAEHEALRWIEIEGSSNVARIAFDGLAADRDGEVGWMYVEFLSEDPLGALYRYKGVPLTAFESVRDAKSVGGMLAKLIKGRYAQERVEVYESASEDPNDQDDLRPLLEAILEETRAARRETANLTRLVKGLGRPRNTTTTTPTGGPTA